MTDITRFHSLFGLEQFARSVSCEVETYDDLLSFRVLGDESGGEVAVLFKWLRGCWGEDSIPEVSAVYVRAATGDCWHRIPAAIIPIATLTALADDYEDRCAERAADRAEELA
jgi:hypothetical protein